MAVIIKDCIKNSPAYKCGIKSGDILVSVNGNEIVDVLDYRFYITENKLIIKVLRDAKELEFTLKKDEYDDPGIEFDTYLMDKQHGCKNRCIFCFIDQLPKGMRKSLYFKDDDSRLSFLFGNYITLTNITRHEIDRIIKMHISPVNISVHTTNPDLRCKMMGNDKAGEALGIIKEFADAGIKMNCQIVLCKGINDGEELLNSLNNLGELYPAVSSVAIVPVGLTKNREKLYDLEGFDKESARDAIKIIEGFSNSFYSKHSTRLAFASDELYIKAELDLPNEEHYEDYPQIENGVGLITSLKTEFMSALELEEASDKSRNLSIATGVDAAPYLKELVDAAKKVFENINVNIYPIKNDFFGHTITVSGLVTGRDIINQLKGKELGEYLLIPSCMLRHEGDLFLDDVSLDDVEKALDISIKTVANDGYELLDYIIGNIE